MIRDSRKNEEEEHEDKGLSDDSVEEILGDVDTDDDEDDFGDDLDTEERAWE